MFLCHELGVVVWTWNTFRHTETYVKGSLTSFTQIFLWQELFSKCTKYSFVICLIWQSTRWLHLLSELSAHVSSIFRCNSMPTIGVRGILWENEMGRVGWWLWWMRWDDSLFIESLLQKVVLFLCLCHTLGSHTKKLYWVCLPILQSGPRLRCAIFNGIHHLVRWQSERKDHEFLCDRVREFEAFEGAFFEKWTK